MNENIKNFIKELSCEHLLFLSQACRYMKNNKELGEKVINLCECQINEYFKEEIGFFGEVVSEYKASDYKSFLYKVLSCKQDEVLFFKDFFKNLYNDSRIKEYRIMYKCIEFVINIKEELKDVSFDINVKDEDDEDLREMYSRVMPVSFIPVNIKYEKDLETFKSSKILKKVL